MFHSKTHLEEPYWRDIIYLREETLLSIYVSSPDKGQVSECLVDVPYLDVGADRPHSGADSLDKQIWIKLEIITA